MDRRIASSLTAPNLITLARLALTPLILAAALGERWLNALLIFAAAGVSDAIDGYIARRFDMRSALGAFLDPLADKTLLVVTFSALAMAGAIPAWLAVVVIGRDVLILCAIGTLWASGRRLAFAPLPVSKLNTAAQIGYAGLVLAALAFGWSMSWWIAPASWGLAGFAALSLGAYIVQWSRRGASSD